jgi:hypothetical protein
MATACSFLQSDLGGGPGRNGGALRSAASDVSLARPPFPRLCAICAERPAAVFDEIDGRRLAVCNGCISDEVPDPPPPPAPRERVLQVLARMPGADIWELCEAMGENDELSRARVSAVLKRAIQRKLVTYEGHRMNRTYTVRPPRRRRRK